MFNDMREDDGVKVIVWIRQYSAVKVNDFESVETWYIHIRENINPVEFNSGMNSF